jgi:hypothetical protein
MLGKFWPALSLLAGKRSCAVPVENFSNDLWSTTIVTSNYDQCGEEEDNGAEGAKDNSTAEWRRMELEAVEPGRWKWKK